MNRMAVFHLVTGIIFGVTGSFSIIISILTRIQSIVWHETLSYEIMMESLSASMFGILIGLILLIGGTSLSYHFYREDREKELPKKALHDLFDLVRHYEMENKK